MSGQPQTKNIAPHRAEDVSFRSSRAEHYRSILRSLIGDIYKTLTFAYAGSLLSLAAIISAANIKGDGITTLVTSSAVVYFRWFGTLAIILTLIGISVAMIGFFYSFRNAEMERDTETRALEELIYGKGNAVTIIPKESQLLKVKKGLFKWLAGISISIFCLVIALEALLVIMMFHR